MEMARGKELTDPVGVGWKGPVIVSWRNKAVICGLGSRVPVHLRLLAGKRKC